MAANTNNDIYDELAQTWWDEKEFLQLLTVMVNPWRVPFFKNVLVKYYGPDLSQVRLLDGPCVAVAASRRFVSVLLV